MSLLALTGSEFFYVPTSEVLPVSPKASVSTFWSWDWAYKYGNSCRWDPVFLQEYRNSCNGVLALRAQIQKQMLVGVD